MGLDNLPSLIVQRYQIIETIGEGAMGRVYRGLDVQTNQTVAIKRLMPYMTTEDSNLIERFKREGEVLSQLNHRNIVKMLATIEEHGNHYIVMEYVGGGSLGERLKREPRLTIEQIIKIGIELADALVQTHHLGIIHRDLKPTNI